MKPLEALDHELILLVLTRAFSQACGEEMHRVLAKQPLQTLEDLRERARRVLVELQGGNDA